MKRGIALLWLAAVLVAPLRGSAPGRDPAALFPELDGWGKEGAVESFLPANLYEHINGAAENFLAYDFRRLDVQRYANDRKQKLSAEIYEHGSVDDAFGIYASEKPLAGDFLDIGGEGYRELGVLNFIAGAYYVKLEAFDAGPDGASVLQDLARKIAGNLGGARALPSLLDAFPARGRIAHSERFLRQNFLGHDFLGPAFAADYELQGEKVRLFVIRTGNGDEARAMLQRYAALDKGFAGEIKPGSLIIADPYNGPLRLVWQGRYVVGAIGAGEAAEAVAVLLQEMAGSLKH
ncbi:MAG: hypothetical protein JXO51_02870 [Candidatus Aminicenantes bacterium]|nr:hypothetical protein [Candidatus Aminicenantes bacterium]